MLFIACPDLYTAAIHYIVRYYKPVGHAEHSGIFKVPQDSMLLKHGDNFFLIVRMNIYLHILHALAEKISSLCRNIQVLVRICGGILKVLVCLHIHVIKRIEMTCKAFGDLVIYLKLLLILFSLLSVSYFLVNIPDSKNEVVIGLIDAPYKTQSMIDRLSIDHKAVFYSMLSALANK